MSAAGDAASASSGAATRTSTAEADLPIPSPSAASARADADAAALSQQEHRAESEREWLSRRKNVLVMTRAGKPVYSSGGDELQLSALFGLLQAMLAKTDDRLRVVRAGAGFVMVFAVRGPLLLAVAARGRRRRDRGPGDAMGNAMGNATGGATGDAIGDAVAVELLDPHPVGYLQLQLEYVYATVLFHFTLGALVDTFQRKPGYDLRGMLGGARTELEGVVALAENSPALLLAAAPVLQLPLETRSAATSVLLSARQPNVLYAVLLADGKLVAQVSPRRHPLKASDLLLLVNFVSHAKQLRAQETWTPLCLPGFNSSGFLHAYAAYVSADACLLLLSSGESLEQFHFCSERKTHVAAQLVKAGIAERISAAVRRGPVAPEACEAASSIHIVFRSLKHDQYFETAVAAHAPLHSSPASRRRLNARYVGVSERLHSHRRTIDIVAPVEVSSPSGSDGGGGDQATPSATSASYADTVEQAELWDVRDSEAVLAVVNTAQHFELYASFHIFTSASQAMACATRFAAWVRQSRNANDLFMLKHQTW